MSLRRTLVVLAGLLVALPAAALPTFNIQFAAGTDPGSFSTWTPSSLGTITNNPDGTTTYEGSSPFGGGNFAASWDVTTDLDPFVDGIFAVTNNTLVDQTFIVTFLSPVVPPLPSATGGASAVGTLTVDNNGVGTGTLGHVGGVTPFFTALVDNADFMTLLDPDSSVTLSFGSASTAPDNFGLPFLTEPIPGGVSTNIGIRLSFTLTPGDSASFTSRFEVVPEPTAGLLLGMGLVGLAIARRRR